MIGSIENTGVALGHFRSTNTSIGSFMAIVRQAVNRSTGHSRQNPDLTGKGPPSTGKADASTTDPSKLSSDASLLPPRTRADALLANYWNTAHAITPVVSRKKMTRYYDTLWRGQDNSDDESEFLCILNAIFALSALADHTTDVQARRTAANSFFQRARDLLVFWRPASIQRVQSFLLLAQYLQSTNESQQLWMFAGYAVRTAESLGIHLAETTDRILDISQREECRRVWQVCIFLDRTLAMVYGRPTTIKQDVAGLAPRPLRLDEENYPSSTTAHVPASDRPQLVDFFLFSQDLFNILSQVLEESYDPRSRKKSPSVNEHLPYFANGLSFLDIDLKLTTWEHSLPKHLQNYRGASEIYAQERPPTKDVILVRQAVMLRQK
ncbi:hypothetical protein MMC08_009046 [Hypocenomyce scalaris]|nr:hypothetical protein [Hypocenomyce scalaris]